MNQSKVPLWKRSMLKYLNINEMAEMLQEILEDGDPYGYDDSDNIKKSEYYDEYRPLFDELSLAAYGLMDVIRNIQDLYFVDSDSNKWDDVAVGLLGHQERVLGYDTVEDDYYSMVDPYEDEWAVEEAIKRLNRLTKEKLIRTFKSVFSTVVLFFDVKAAHDCLTAVVTELEEKGAMLSRKNDEINRLYKDLTGGASEQKFDEIVRRIPQRMWVE